MWPTAKLLHILAKLPTTDIWPNGIKRLWQNLGDPVESGNDQTTTEQ